MQGENHINVSGFGRMDLLIEAFDFHLNKTIYALYSLF